MAGGRYRVVVNGFEVRNETWDTIFQEDGAGDEVFIRAEVVEYAPDGETLISSVPISAVLGDTLDQHGRVQAGTRARRGGLRTGDKFPNGTPWERTLPLTIERNYPPYMIWEGDLEQDGGKVVLIPSIWEWDGGSSDLVNFLLTLNEAFSDEDVQKAVKALPGVAVLFSPIQLGLGAFVILEKLGLFGHKADRPIGSTKKAGAEALYEFSPQVIVLDYERAEHIIKQQPSGRGLGVFALEFRDADELKGHYLLWLQVEKAREMATRWTPIDGLELTYGNTFKLKHELTSMTLHSHPHNYGHPFSSLQQQVTAAAGSDDNDLWVVKGPHPVTYAPRPTAQPWRPPTPRGPYDRWWPRPDAPWTPVPLPSPQMSQIRVVGAPVVSGDVIRLEHKSTRRNLHSHPGVPSPVTQQQEVTCWGESGEGDGNDNWRVEVEGGGPVVSSKRLRLVHVNTGRALHSHYGYSHPEWTQGQQEVTGAHGRDANDWWYLSEVH